MYSRTRSWSGALAALALGTVVLAGCGAPAGRPSPTGSGAAAAAPTGLKPSPSATAAGEVSEDLTFSGALSGRMRTARRGEMYVCAGGNVAPSNPNTTGQLVVGPIVGDVDGRKVQMNITKISYRGPGSYDAGGVGFDVGGDHYFPANAPSGKLVVDPGGRSGTLAIDLAKNSAPSTVVGHVEGSWQCPAD